MTPVLVPRDYLRGVELVGELVEDASARLGHGEEAFERERLYPGKVGAGGEHAARGGAVAAQGDPLDLSLPGREQARRLGGRLLDELAFLPSAATAEARTSSPSSIDSARCCTMGTSASRLTANTPATASPHGSANSCLGSPSNNLSAFFRCLYSGPVSCRETT